MEEHFDYLVGFYWKNTVGIGTYEYFGTVKHGTIEDAKNYLEFVKERNPARSDRFKLFKVIPLEIV